MKTVDALAQRARLERPATGDVREAVLARLREDAAPRVATMPMVLFTAVYAAAAVALVAVALNVTQTAETDPLAPLFALAQTLTL